MLNVDEIQEEIEKLMTELEKVGPQWAKAKADKNYSDEMKRTILNVVRSASKAKTVAAREEEAYASEEYKKYLYRAFNVDVKYYRLEARKNYLETTIDAYRSLDRKSVV